MGYCNQCGKPLEPGARFCNYCGARADSDGRRSAAPAPAAKPTLAETLGRFFTVSDETSSFAKNDTEQNRSTALLSYLHILVFVPMFAMRESKFTQYHVRLGENLLFYQLLAEILGAVLLHALGWIPVLNVLLYILVIGVNLGLWGIAVFGIRAAAKGRALELVNFSRFKLFR